MVARIVDEVPVYRRLPPDGLANVERLASRNCRRLTEALRTGARLERDDLRYVAEHARERVRRGVSLEAMLHAYRVGLTAFWEEVMSEAIALGFSRDAALALARRTSELSDDLTTHAAETYVREESRLRAVSEQEARDLLELLLRGEADADTLKSRRVAPGLDLHERLLVVLARVASTTPSPGDVLDLASQPIARALSTGRASPLVAVRNGAVVAIAPAQDGPAVVERLTALHDRMLAQGTELFFGLGTPSASLAGVPVAFDQAALAVSRASVEQPVVALSELPVVQSLMLGATSTMRTLLEMRARALDLGDRELPMVRETLRALADADMNLTHAADALHVHPNTLRYRLRRIRERTGLDPRTFAGLVDLVCLIGLAGYAPEANTGASVRPASSTASGSWTSGSTSVSPSIPASRKAPARSTI